MKGCFVAMRSLRARALGAGDIRSSLYRNARVVLAYRGVAKRIISLRVAVVTPLVFMHVCKNHGATAGGWILI